MQNLGKIFYRCLKGLLLRRKSVILGPSVLFNTRTFFEGTNKVHKNVCVSNSNIGYGTYIGENTYLPNCQIGRFCSIAPNVKVITATHPSSNFVSTSPMFFSTLKQTGKTFCYKNKYDENLTIDKRSLIIGNDVWIGEGVVIKGGIQIGDGAIIAMNACVTKDVPPYAIVGGIPAKIIRYRFTEEQIKSLKKIQWWNKSLNWIEQYADKFDNIDDFLKIVD